MISLRPLAALMLIGTTASAAVLPLKPGTYVLAGTACKDPAFAAMFSYNGRQFAYPHAGRCRSTILSHDGRSYRIREACSALGDGSPAAPTASVSTYTVASATQVSISAKKREERRYRWCPAA